MHTRFTSIELSLLPFVFKRARRGCGVCRSIRPQIRRVIVDGTTPLYVQGRETPLVGAEEASTTDEREWIRVPAEDFSPRGVPTVTVEAIRDTGCLDLSRKDLETGRRGVPAGEATLAAMLGDIYTHGAR